MEELKKKLQEMAAREAHCECEPAFIEYGWSGDCATTAYWAGQEDGTILFARMLLEQFFENK